GIFAHDGYLTHVAVHVDFTDEVIRRLDHLKAPGQAGQKKDTHCAFTCRRPKGRDTHFVRVDAIARAFSVAASLVDQVHVTVVITPDRWQLQSA
ncbi:hypothetical protein, partial [Pseudomonas sp. BEA3.1]|uniref:hypothetical protein n=1 Tax=Pseudomonas sp. BEA3.1 TaxID=3083251 RepID=UPI00296476DA